MKGVSFNSIKKLLDKMESGELEDINSCLSDCWEELTQKERKADILPEVLSTNKQILEELSTLIRRHEEKPILEEELHQIRLKVLSEEQRASTNQEYPSLSEDVSELNDLLKEIERKMKEENSNKE